MGRDNGESLTQELSISDITKSGETTHIESMQAVVSNRKPADMVQSMVESGITEVPPEFVKPPHERVSSTRSPNLSDESRVTKGLEPQIPVIDLAMLDDGKESLLAEMSRACEEWGCFQLVHHGVPGCVMDEAMEAAKRFFALPGEEKEEFRMTALGGMGYGRYFDRPGVVKDWNDRLVLTDFSKDDSRPGGARIDLLLTKPPGALEVLERYGQAVEALTQHLTRVFSECLGASPDFLSSLLRVKSSTVMNYYPACPQPELVMGMAPHEDGGAFTLLQQNQVVGLEVLSPDEEHWVPVFPVEHAFVVTVADVMQVISNGRFKSVTHRVFAGPRSRFVIASFVGPVRHAMVQPVPEFCSESNPPVYKSIVYSEYLKMVLFNDLKMKRLEVLEIDRRSRTADSAGLS